ncbi:hypothetical protein [Rugamonas aquatica]|uniref:Uncharacterized protein n=1 Tax=Rugamonas aquatica TaxID=2743357 RepID=A0A6A7N2A6_9BURK|nr:hypothetical protein [Rugamonas aquatica]MQA39132.1 hypothetical protein [Rugamonas aquatica]
MPSVYVKLRELWRQCHEVRVGYLARTRELLEEVKRPAANAAFEQLLGEVAALHCRIFRRSPRRRPELIALLQGAVYTAAHDVDKGRELYKQAEQRFQQSMQTTNQLAFIGGAFFGALIGMIAGYWMIGLTTSKLPLAGNLADGQTIASLCFYGLFGSLTSIWLRVSAMSLQQVDSLAFVIVSGMIQPFIALGFVAVIFVIIRYQVLGISIGTEGNKEAVLWVAAFLCGFSERFAPAILNSTAAAFTAGKSASK